MKESWNEEFEKSRSWEVIAVNVTREGRLLLKKWSQLNMADFKGILGRKETETGTQAFKFRHV